MQRIPTTIPLVILFLACLWNSLAYAAKIEVLGLFKNRAVALIDGTRRVLKVGIKSPEGVMLISASSRQAIIEMDGESKTYFLGGRIGGVTKPVFAEVKIIANRNDMFLTFGSINGQGVQFLIDTGATTIAMNSKDAARLGINFRVYGKLGQVRTASGQAKAYSINLNTVKVGAITLRKVLAVVLEGDSPSEVLLGMSFLSRVRMENTGKIMLLQQKF